MGPKWWLINHGSWLVSLTHESDSNQESAASWKPQIQQDSRWRAWCHDGLIPRPFIRHHCLNMTRIIKWEKIHNEVAVHWSISFICFVIYMQHSEWQDSNLRSPVPKTGMLAKLHHTPKYHKCFSHKLRGFIEGPRKGAGTFLLLWWMLKVGLEPTCVSTLVLEASAPANYATWANTHNHTQAGIEPAILSVYVTKYLYQLHHIVSITDRVSHWTDALTAWLPDMIMCEEAG